MTDLFPHEDERVPFSVLASRAPHHDPASCTREPCSRCRPKGKPRTPEPVDHEARTPVNPPTITRMKIGADHLTATLEETLRRWRPLGQGTIDRFAAWEHAPQPASDERGGGDGGTANDDTARDRLDDRQASRYRHELDQLTQRIHADLSRLNALVQLAHPEQRRALKLTDLSAGQLIADGWCPSCFRHDRYLEPITPNRYADRCRRCGDHRKATGADPTLEELRLMHSRGKRLRKRSA